MDLTTTGTAILLVELYGFGKEVLSDWTASKISEQVGAQEILNLLEECLDQALRDKSIQFDRISAGASLASVSINKGKLRELLSRSFPIEQLTISTSDDQPSEDVCKIFADIIQDQGVLLNEKQRFEMIRAVLRRAQEIFYARVPREHPAFEQVVLAYQRKQSSDLNVIKTVIGAGRPLRDPRVTAAPRKRNPFESVAADDLDLSNPEHVRRIKSLFITRYTDIPTTRKRFNTIIEGQRGTGKTMMMKYLAFETQLLEWREAERSEAEFFTEAENFIGVYCKLGQGVFDKSDFEALRDQSLKERVFEHRLVLHILVSVLRTLDGILTLRPLGPENIRRLRRALCDQLKVTQDSESMTGVQELVSSMRDYISFRLVRDVDEYLSSRSPGGRSKGRGSFVPWLTLSSQLPSFLDLLREIIQTRLPFYLMLDDFDVLEGYQQQRVFKAASLRQFETLCFKFGIMVLGRKVAVSGEGRTFRIGDDYDHLDLDWTQGGLHLGYSDAVRQIAAARLQAYGYDPDVATLFPDWSTGREIWNRMKGEMEAEWEKAERKPTKAKSDFVAKYGNARFFQILREKKTRMRYAGMEYVTAVSSGVFRQFLEVCKLVVDRALADDDGTELRGIKAEIQDLAIREYSDSMIQQFSRTAGDAHDLLKGDIEITSKHMVTLIESLCDVFYSRLHTPFGEAGGGEPEIICIAVRDGFADCPEAETYLKIGIRESILHKFQYPPKTAGGPPLPSFMLNRRLGPRRDLSIRQMQGRIEIAGKDVLVAVADRKKFHSLLRPRGEESAAQEALGFGEGQTADS